MEDEDGGRVGVGGLRQRVGVVGVRSGVCGSGVVVVVVARDGCGSCGGFLPSLLLLIFVFNEDERTVVVWKRRRRWLCP